MSIVTMGPRAVSRGEGPVVGLIYDDDAFVESTGLFGRRVAGRTFLDSYLAHGRFAELVALIRNPESTATLIDTWRGRFPAGGPLQSLRIVEMSSFHRAFFPEAPATLIHAPQPTDARFAWVRQYAGTHAFALSGVTHTLCSLEAMWMIRELVTAPFEPYDSLICTSRAVVDMVRQLMGSYAEFLRSRFGGTAAPERSIRLEMIPLGVDVDRFRPPGAAERAEARKAIEAAEDEVVVLFVGRLSHHAKAHPFPLFRATSEAARQAGRKVHLVLAGWAPNAAIDAGFRDAARRFAPDARTTFVDGRDDLVRRQVWQAADLFVSPSDNIQETFGLVVIEAMAAGLPVVATDWDGYRDLVVDGETGFLVPTYMAEGATVGSTSRLLIGELCYEHFISECSQATAVDLPATISAVSRLVGDEAMRKRMGAAGRRRAVERFAWPRVIAAYERLWAEQEQARREYAARRDGRPSFSGPDGPAIYPAPERSFAGYPTRMLDGPDRVSAGPRAREALEVLLALNMTHHASVRRPADPAPLRAAIDRAPCSIADLDRLLAEAGVEPGVGRASIAWMLKYDLLRLEGVDHTPGGLDR